MTDTAEQSISRGRNAKYLLESESFQAVIADLKAGTLSDWLATQASHTDKRETAYFQMQALGAIESKLKAWVESAKVDADRLERANQRTSRQA